MLGGKVGATQKPFNVEEYTPSFRMEEERKGKPATVIGGMYAKAKQRVLNKMGKRTSKLGRAFLVNNCFALPNFLAD